MSMNQLTNSPWTEDLRDEIASLIVNRRPYDNTVSAVLDALAPRVAELQRAAKVAALLEFAGFIAAPVHGGLDQYTLGEVVLEAHHRADEIERGEK
jgi:hypothetical protein